MMMSEDLHGLRLRPGDEKDNYKEPGVTERDDEVLPHCRGTWNSCKPW